MDLPVRLQALDGNLEIAAHVQSKFDLFNLSYDRGGGPYVPPQSVFIFLSKISPPDQTLRPTCKFLILVFLYHDFFFLFLIYYLKSKTIYKQKIKKKKKLMVK